jgi:ATP-dependent protease HslVU (ClpYQ) peptidase subunit
MTVVVAVRTPARTVVAADSLVTFGGQRFPAKNAHFHKIHHLGDTLVAWAGWSIYAELLSAYLAHHPPPPLRSEDDVFGFFVAFWRTLRTDYHVSALPQTREQAFADLQSSFLLANAAGIFRVAEDMDVTLFEQYTAVGSGSKYALGALRVLYDESADPIAIARRAVQVGIDFDVHCGGDIDIAEVQ